MHIKHILGTRKRASYKYCCFPGGEIKYVRVEENGIYSDAHVTELTDPLNLQWLAQSKDDFIPVLVIGKPISKSLHFQTNKTAFKFHHKAVYMRREMGTRVQI